MTAASLAAVTVASAQTVQIGLGDQAIQSLADPRFAALGITTVRIVVPWDVTQSDPWRITYWMNAAEQRAIEPVIALGRAASDRCPGSPCVLPTSAQYRSAFDDLHRRFPSVHVFIPWNEPNHGTEPTATDPAMAAHYADIVREDCPDCTIVAGDLLDAPGMLTYLDFYKAALTTAPSAWGLHNYYDTTYFQPTNTEAFLGAVNGPVWLTESGGIVTWRTPDGRVQLTYDEQRAAASLDYGLRLAAAHADRIQRMYVYQWQAGPADDFDAGLIRADGSARPGLDVLRAAVGLGTGSTTPAGTDQAGIGAGRLVAPPALPAAVLEIARMTVSRNGVVDARLRCTGGRCLGRLTVEGRGGIAERLVNGRSEHGTLVPRTRRFDLMPGSQFDVRVELPRAVMQRAHRHRSLLAATALPALPGSFTPVRRLVRFPRSLQART